MRRQGCSCGSAGCVCSGHRSPEASMPDANQRDVRFDEARFLFEVRKSFEKLPELSMDFLPILLVRILRYECQDTGLTPEERTQVLEELVRLLKHEKIRRSEMRSKMLTALVIALLLDRPQLCATDGLVELCNVHPDTAFAVHKGRIVDHLVEDYKQHTGVKLGFGYGRGAFLPLPSFPGKPVAESVQFNPTSGRRRRFPPSAYKRHLAKMLGKTVLIYTRTGDLLVNDEVL